MYCCTTVRLVKNVGRGEGEEEPAVGDDKDAGEENEGRAEEAFDAKAGEEVELSLDGYKVSSDVVWRGLARKGSVSDWGE